MLCSVVLRLKTGTCSHTVQTLKKGEMSSTATVFVMEDPHPTRKEKYIHIPSLLRQCCQDTKRDGGREGERTREERKGEREK
jgi:hypothetical protein